MLALKLPEIHEYVWQGRRNAITRRVVLLFVFGIFTPLILLGLFSRGSDDLPRTDQLEVARLVLEDQMHRNPPNGAWRLTQTRFNDKGKLEMDVEISNYDQAAFIRSRPGRLRYSYLKLACPSPNSEVFEHMLLGETVWVHLQFKGETLITGACPVSMDPS